MFFFFLNFIIEVIKESIDFPGKTARKLTIVLLTNLKYQIIKELRHKNQI